MKNVLERHSALMSTRMQKEMNMILMMTHGMFPMVTSLLPTTGRLKTSQVVVFK